MLEMVSSFFAIPTIYTYYIRYVRVRTSFELWGGGTLDISYSSTVYSCRERERELRGYIYVQRDQAVEYYIYRSFLEPFRLQSQLKYSRKVKKVVFSGR